MLSFNVVLMLFGFFVLGFVWFGRLLAHCLGSPTLAALVGQPTCQSCLGQPLSVVLPSLHFVLPILVWLGHHVVKWFDV